MYLITNAARDILEHMILIRMSKIYHGLCLSIFRFLCTVLQIIISLFVLFLFSRVVDRDFEPQSGQTKDYRFGIGCFSAKHAALKRQSKDWLSGNQDNVCEWGAISIRGLSFQ
jgi:hypothetical protein